MKFFIIFFYKIVKNRGDEMKSFSFEDLDDTNECNCAHIATNHNIFYSVNYQPYKVNLSSLNTSDSLLVKQFLFLDC